MSKEVFGDNIEYRSYVQRGIETDPKTGREDIVLDVDAPTPHFDTRGLRIKGGFGANNPPDSDGLSSSVPLDGTLSHKKLRIIGALGLTIVSFPE